MESYEWLELNPSCLKTKFSVIISPFWKIRKIYKYKKFDIRMNELIRPKKWETLKLVQFAFLYPLILEHHSLVSIATSAP